MDLSFACPNCKQEMLVDSSGAGSEVNCPACNAVITIPGESTGGGSALNPIMSSAAAKEHRHYAVPQHEAPSEVLIQKPNAPLEAASKDTDKTVKIRSIKRSDCVEVGHDRFDERVSEFLGKVGETNIISINTMNYTHLDIATRQWMNDYGVIIVYRG